MMTIKCCVQSFIISTSILAVDDSKMIHALVLRKILLTINWWCVMQMHNKSFIAHCASQSALKVINPLFLKTNRWQNKFSDSLRYEASSRDVSPRTKDAGAEWQERARRRRKSWFAGGIVKGWIMSLEGIAVIKNSETKLKSRQRWLLRFIRIDG